jgi:two-component system LytT family response regulator
VIRALVVDDEAPARDRLRLLLSEQAGVEVVGEAEDGQRAAEQIAVLAPTVVFLDIQMPGCNGLEVAASLPAAGPQVIFCTAYDRYAVDAFELHAVDYLLKPVTRARLDKAVERIRRGGLAPDGAGRALRATRPATRFLARKAGSYHVIHARDVLCFQSDAGLTKLLTAQGHYWLPPTLNDLESRLDPRQFFRVSRAAIVNLDAIRELVPAAGGQGEVALRDGTRVEISRRRFRDLTERLSG